MTQYDSIRKFACEQQKTEPKKEEQVPNDKKFIIDEVIYGLCNERHFPEHYYRAYLRGYYKNSREFIQAICVHHDIIQHKILVKYHEYTLQTLEKTPDAELTKVHEENGIRNFRDITLKAYANTINIMLKAQRNLIRDLDSPNIEVSLEATKMAVKIMGKKMASCAEKIDELDDITENPEAEEPIAIDDSGDQVIDGVQQKEETTTQEISGQE